MPYMTGYTADVEKALFLRRFSVPFWALTYYYNDTSYYYDTLTSTLIGET
jgi:hypothetical protein